MLDPDDRQLLVEALKPPPGMTLDVAVGTTFTLDLQALLLAPVSFAFFGHGSNSGQGRDPLALLESVRRHADRITMFCQAGCITVPRTLQPVLAWLEDSVVPVAPPTGLLFHPKVWVLRFVGVAAQTAHRLLVSSRNLTFDTSWDTILRLDELPGGDTGVDNTPLQRFLGSLSRTAVQRPSDARLAQIEDLADSLGMVQWELPDGCRELRFWPLGLAGAGSPSMTSDRSLVVSPFLSIDRISKFGVSGTNGVVISRAESIDEVGGIALSGFEGIYVIDADPLSPDHQSEEEEGSPPAEPTEQVELERPGTLLQGLHAKLYLLERGDDVHLFTGSANATDAGFGGNIEFVVEMTGRRADWGIDMTLDAKGHRASLRDLLRPYIPAAPEPTEPDELSQLMYRLDSLVRRVAAVPFTMRVLAAGDEYELRIQSGTAVPTFSDDIVVTARPASVGVGVGVAARLTSGQRVDHAAGVVTLAGITSFVAITATAQLDGREVRSAALANASLVGAPSDRKERLLSAQLTSSDDLIRYLLFLLYELTDDAQLDQIVASFGAGTSRWAHADQIPLFETMLRALANSHRSLDRVAELLDDLRATTDGAKVIPSGLDEIWGPIDEVRKTMSI